MQRTTVAALVCAGVLVGAWVGPTFADDKKKKPLPAAVLEALKRAYPQATVGDAERERVVLTIHEVEVRDGTTQVVVKVASDGTIVGEERRMAQADLPSPVLAALSKAQGKVKKIERYERRARLRFVALETPIVLFEADLEREGGKKAEVCFKADGTETDDDGDDGDDEDDGDDDEDDEDDGDDDDDDDDKKKAVR